MSGFLLFGFLIGMRHALEADHLAAVTILATRAKNIRQIIPLGVMWGMGHTFTLFVFSSMIVLLNKHLSQNITVMIEALVGVMLVILGADIIFRLIKERMHFHVHGHADIGRHFHAHSHQNEKNHENSPHSHDHFKEMSIRALAIGMIHGLAGSAALVLLTMQSVESLSAGIIYISMFGLGSIAGMGLLSFVIAIPMCYLANFMTWAFNGLSVVLGVFSVGLGLFNIYFSVIFI